MKLKSRYIFFFLLSINLVSCTNNNIKLESNELPPSINYLYSPDYAKYYLYNNFQDNEKCIKYLFDFIKGHSGKIEILTDKDTFEFEDNVLVKIDTTKQRFTFSRRLTDNLENTYVRVNFLKSEKVKFQEKKGNGKTELSAMFKTLNLNILQNFLDYAQDDDLKKSMKTYIYELYNKDKIKKVVLTYHDNGQWFEVEIL